MKGPPVHSYAETWTDAREQSLGRMQSAHAEPGLEAAGFRKRTKVMIAIGAAVGFAAVVYAIDHGVVNNTLSSLGKRKD